MLNLLGLYVDVDGRLVMCGAGNNMLCMSVTLLVETHLQNLHLLLRCVRVFGRLVLRHVIVLMVGGDAFASFLASLFASGFARHHLALG